MSTTWEIEQRSQNRYLVPYLVIRGLKKSFHSSITIPLVDAADIEVTPDNRGLDIRLTSIADVDFYIEVILLPLHEAGFIDTAQAVELKKIDDSTVWIHFQHQLPIGFTQKNLQAALPRTGIITDVRSIVVHLSGNATPDIRGCLEIIWEKLFDLGVVRSKEVPRY